MKEERRDVWMSGNLHLCKTRALVALYYKKHWSYDQVLSKAIPFMEAAAKEDGWKETVTIKEPPQKYFEVWKAHSNTILNIELFEATDVMKMVAECTCLNCEKNERQFVQLPSTDADRVEKSAIYDIFFFLLFFGS